MMAKGIIMSFTQTLSFTFSKEQAYALVYFKGARTRKYFKVKMKGFLSLIRKQRHTLTYVDLTQVYYYGVISVESSFCSSQQATVSNLQVSGTFRYE